MREGAEPQRGRAPLSCGEDVILAALVATDEWRWTDDQGVQRVVRTDELRSALASSVLAPSTLVWREGMASWAPAFSVPELGAADPQGPAQEMSTDGTTDIRPSPDVGDGPPDSPAGAGAEQRGGYPNIAPPPMVVGGKLAAHAGSTADTGRPTPTDLLPDGLSMAQASAANGARAPLPAARSPATRGAAAPLKIGAAPRPAAAPIPRPVSKVESSSVTASKVGGARATPWRKPELGKTTRHDEDVTLVAEASDPFKVKPAVESGSNGASAASPAGNSAAGAASPAPGEAAKQPAGAKRPVTHTAVLPGNEPAKPAAGAARSPSTAPAAGGPVVRKLASGVPPPPVQVGPRRALSNAPPGRGASASTPAAPGVASGARGSSAPPAGAARGAAGQGAQAQPAAQQDPKGFKTTAFMDSGTSPSQPPGAAEVPPARGAALSVPSAPRLPNLARGPFSITENTSTDSTGVLPLSGSYSAEPKQQDDQPRPAEGASSHGGAPSIAQPSPASLTGPLPDQRAPLRSQPPPTDPAQQAAHAQQAAQEASRAAYAASPAQPQHGGYAASPSQHGASPLQSQHGGYAASPSQHGASPLQSQHGGAAASPSQPQHGGYASPTQSQHGGYAGSPPPGRSSALASYPPAPMPMISGPSAGAPRMEVDVQALAQGFAQPAAMLRAEAAAGYGAAPMAGAQGEGTPYSAPPPPLALVDPPAGELRATGALPLVHPKRSQHPATISQPPPAHTSQPPPAHTSQPPPAATTQPPPALDAADQPGEAFPPAQGKMGDPIVVPISSLFSAGAILIAMAVAAFFIGRSSVPAAAGTGPARAAFAALPRLARLALPSPPKPCWMAKQPVRWATSVVQSVPVDVAPTPSGVVVAFARDTREPATVEVDFASGAFTEKPADKRDGDLVRVFAPRDGSALLATTKADAGALAPYIFAPGPAPFVVGVAGKGTSSPSVAAAEKPDGAPETLWTLPSIEEDKGLEAARLLGSGPSTYALVFRRAGSILAGYVAEGRKPSGNLSVVAGSGGSVGKPSLGSNKREIAVVFGDRVNADSPWEIRVGHAPLGQMPRETMVVPLPKGGPGGDAFAPDIAGTPDGRWVIVWTEGKTGAYAVRAQTFGADFKPLGDPIAISPPAGNFGQAVVGVAGSYVTTMFLSRASGGSYELWGAVLQCGS
jgi:hypothetical protein